ncbi:MFS transporter [Nesterenkonia marinintestina]|uniref:MFS transporter n=1 Tax=Nesterenkonia marinintestina TaxID=2979865 RepID=UPI0021BF7571|nr:MFS transporter [Nesterenkonia sp. GX14115]
MTETSRRRRRSTTAPADLSPAQRWSVLAIVSSALLLITLDNTVLYTALPRLTEDLDATPSDALWIINAYPLVIAGLLPGSGALGERLGHQRIFQYGLVIFGVASLLAAFSPTSEVLIAARVGLAVGAAAMMPATLALIRISFPIERERNVAIATWAAVSLVGMAAGPIVGGLLLEFFWWGSVFLINVPIVIAASAAILLAGPANVADPARRWDWVSSAQIMVGLSAAVLALKSLAEPEVSWVTVIVAGVVAAVALTLFARRQLRLMRGPGGGLEEPLIDFAVFRNRAFTAGVIAAGISIFTIMGIQLAGTQRYQLVEGFSPLQAGLLVSALAVGALPMSLLGGAVLHRTGLLVLIAGGIGLSTSGSVVSAFAAWQDSFALLIIGLLVVGAGLGAAMSVASTSIMGNVPPRRAGMAASLEEVSYEFGGLVGVAVLGTLLNFAYLHLFVPPAGAEHLRAEAPAEALQADDPAVVAAGAEALDGAFLIVLVTVVVFLAAAAALTALLLRRYTPGTPSQAYPDNH